MGSALLSIAPVFVDKSQRKNKWLLVANGAVDIGFLIGNAFGVFMVNMLASFIWGVVFPIAALFVVKMFRDASKSIYARRWWAVPDLNR
jgi:hypothetical protein